MSFLDCIRRVDKQISTSKKITNTFAILIFGIALGIVSKFFDTTASNELPFIVQYLDIRNFLGRFSIWVLIALCISLYSHSPFRAAINVFLFFLGMITSYYLYSAFIASVCLLVCKRKGACISCHFSSNCCGFVSYDICVWVDLF